MLYILLMEELRTGFVQVVFLGIAVPYGPRRPHSVEGTVVSVAFDSRRAYLLGSHPWVPSGRMHVAAWLALGAPGAPEATFGGLRPAELAAELVRSQWTNPEPTGLA